MRNSRILLKLFMALVGFSGAIHALSTSTTLSKNVIADLNDRATRYDSRTTCAYDSSGNRFFVGATESGAGEYAISMLTTTDGSDIIKAALTPAQIYEIPGEDALVANPAYNARVWEMEYFVIGAVKYVAAIIQLDGETGRGGSRLVIINTADAKETYVSAAAMSCEDATGTASRFVKLAAAHKGSDATARIVIAAVADSTTNEFSTAATSNAGLRAFAIPASPTDNALTQIDINGGTAGSGKLMANTAALMSTKMRRLTSMVWDSRSKVLYLGGHMSDSTLGICGFYLSGSDAVTTLNHSTGGTLISGDATVAAGFPELSRVHSLKVHDNGTRAHLIIQAGSSSRETNNFYALSLTTGVAGAVGKLAQGTTVASAATLRSQTWLALGTNGVYSSTARGLVGNSQFPLAKGSVVTGVNLVGNNLYVSTSGASAGNELWLATATVTTNNIASWTAWTRVRNTTLKDVGGFATNGTYVWAVLDRSSVYVNSAIGSFDDFNQASLGLANIKDLDARVRLRKIAAFDSVNRELILGSATVPDSDGYAIDSLSNYLPATGALATADEVNAASPLASKAIWDMALVTNSDGGIDRYILPNTEIGETPSSGGKMIVKVASTGAVTSITADVYTSPEGYTGNTRRQTFFQDGADPVVDSSCVKILSGKDYATTANVLFAFIKDGDDSPGSGESYFRGETAFDLIKVLNADLSVHGTTPLAYLDVVGGMSEYIRSMQCAYWEPTLNCMYIGSAKYTSADGTDYTDPGISLIKFSNATTLAGAPLFANGDGTETSFRDVYQISSLQTAGSTARTILLVSGTPTNDFGDVSTGNVYAIPVLTSGSNKGKAVGVDYTTVAADVDGTWNQATRPDLFNVGGAIPWNSKSAIVDIKTVGLNVFVTVANAPGITGLTGVFVTTAICSTAGALLGWTPWQLAGGLNTSMQTVAFDAVSGKLIGLELASGMPTVASWKSPEDVSAFDQLAKAFNTDFANNGGVYSLASHTARTGVTYADDALSAASMNMVVATGNKAVAIAHVGYKADSATATVYNPDSTNIYGYKSFMNDSALISLGGVYCSAMSRGSAGWIFAGGENGVAVLRVSGATGDAGKGWTGGVPTSLQDTTSSSTSLSAMTWLKIPGITGPIHKMITVYNYSGTSVDADNHVEALIAMGPRGVYAFTLAAGKFTDADATALQLSSLTEFTSGVSERVWDIAPLYRGAGMFAVGTTRGLYVAKLTGDTPTLSVVAEIEDADSASLGAVASISVIHPIITSAQNPVYRVDCVTANARTDVSKHYSSEVTFVQLGDMSAGKGAVSGTPSATLVKTLDRMTTQILNAAGVYSYSAGVPNRKSASLQVLSSSIQSSTDPVLDGLEIPTGSTLGQLTTVGADGSRLITVGGRVYVKST